MELGLLATALVTIILTSLCLANEIHWAHSDSPTAKMAGLCNIDARKTQMIRRYWIDYDKQS